MTNPKAIAFCGSIFALMVPAAAPRWLEAAVGVVLIGLGGHMLAGR